MKSKMLLRVAAVPIAAALAALPGLAGCQTIGNAACPEYEADFGASLGADVDANVRTFMLAAGNFSLLADSMVKEVGDACVNIATAGGGDPKTWEGMEGDDRVTAACTEAQARIDAVLAAGISIEFLVEGGECKASITATSDCYAKCDVNAQCTPAQLEAHCEPGMLAGKCSADCSGSCEVQGGTVMCDGACSATCTGTCAGNCVGKCDGMDSTGMCAGMCDGRCSAACTGTCSGECTYTAPKATCEGTCHGECSVEFQEPYCEGKFTPPECMIDADCKANCEASVEAQAECTPPTVTYKVVAGGTADIDALAVALQDNLPALLVNTATRADALIATADTLATSANNIAADSELGAKEAACAGLAADAALSASVSVKVSVQASADVSTGAAARAGN